MDIGWIQVFVLTISECVAPAGKTVCQQQEFTLQFVDQQECERALVQLVSLKEEAENVIVDREGARCTRAAREHQVFGSLEEINRQFSGIEPLAAPSAAEPPVDFSREAHEKRLAELPGCDAVEGRAPCRIGEIIIESATEESRGVWRRNN